MRPLLLAVVYVAFAATVGQTAAAKPIELGCNGDGVFRAMVPMDYDDLSGPEFGLAFRLREGSQPGRPLVIVLPGGPGGTLIQDDPNVVSGGIPTDYDVVLTDPRGAGCNDDPRLDQDRYFTSEFLAQDVINIVRWLERSRGAARLDYILYGQSYGTVQATIAAVLAGRMGVTKPRALVLEGTVGHSFASYAEHFANVQAEWREVREKLPRYWRGVFMTNHFDPELSRYTAVWADLVDNDLSQGYLPNGDHMLEWRFTEGSYTIPNMLGLFESKPWGDAMAQGSRVLRVLACNELYGGLYTRRTFRDGELVLEGADACAGTGISHRYDAADWPLTMPVIYFQGQHDVATPPSQARYHFDHETTAPRYYVGIDLAGHAALSVTLAVGDCRARLWDAIASDLETLGPAVTKCDHLESRAHVALDHVPELRMVASPISLPVSGVANPIQ